MILIAAVAAAVIAVVLSEVLGGGRVIYTRVMAMALAYAVSCGGAAMVLARFGGGPSAGVAAALSAIPLMAAWLGFRIHLSNSVTLEMLTLLVAAGPQPADRIIAAYDPRAHAASRLQILREAGYLVGPDDRVAATAKGRAVLLLIRFLCGPAGPRSVAAMLERQAGARS